MTNSSPTLPPIGATVLNPGESFPGYNSPMVPTKRAVTPFEQLSQASESSRPASPWEHPAVKRVVAKARELFNDFLIHHRGEPLREEEEVPNLLLLYAAQERFPISETREILKALSTRTFKISTSEPVRVYWDNQPFVSVPYQAKDFPLAVATQILHYCKTTKFHNQQTIFDAAKGKSFTPQRSDEDRIVISFFAQREPTEDEEKTMAGDYGLSGVSGTLSMPSTSGSTIMMSLAPGASQGFTKPSGPSRPPLG